MNAIVFRTVDWLSGSPWRLGLVAGVYTLTITWFIQLVILGLIVPHWGDGNGLVPGQDVERFHAVAVAQAEAIALHGWSAWELRPNGWGISGIMSVWYALTIPQPWALAPVQALAYGICVVLIAKLVLQLTASPRLSLLAMIPAVLLPSAAFIYAQPHRDLYVMLGLILASYGWWLVLAMQGKPGRIALKMALGSLVFIVAGFISAWAAREFSAEIFQGIAGLMSLVAICFAAVHLYRTRVNWWSTLASPMVSVLLLLGMLSYDIEDFFSHELPSESEITEVITTQGEAWQPTGWLPSAVDDAFRRLAGARDHFLRGYSHGRTVIDTDVQYRQVGDMLVHTPRAVQVALFSPFPDQWLPHPEAEPVRNVYRMIGGLEMAILYVILPFLLYAGWCWWRRPAFWALLMPALSWVMVYAYTVPVVGALVRYRFPGYIVLVVLALAGLGQAVVHWRSARRSRLTAQP